jgi:hypothetical protein
MRIGALALTILPMLSGAACAETKWTVSTRPYLEARSTEEESDASLRAVCRSSGSIELRVGAAEGVGKGSREAVTLQFESAGQHATLRGVSRESDDFQMTGGTELVADVTADDPVFAVLTSGKPVKLSGSLKTPVVWGADGVKRAVTQFLADCRGR